MNTKKWRISVIGFYVFLMTLLAAGSDSIPMSSNTAELWKKLDAARNDGLPQTAIDLTKEIYRISLGGRRYAESLKALGIHLSLMMEINHDWSERIGLLKKEISSVPSEIQSFMHAMLAHQYWAYFQQERWRILHRSQTAGIDEEDFTTWDLPRLYRQISLHFQEALKNEESLRNISIGTFKDFLEKGTMPDSLRPTLFDFLAHEALTFFFSGEWAAALPQDAFEIDDESPALGKLDDFLAYRPQADDPQSPKFLALILMQKILRFHKNEKQKEALYDADVTRLKYMRNASVGEKASERYIERLREIAENDSNLEPAAQACYLWALELFGQEKFIEAVQVCRKGISISPKGRGGVNCHALITSISSKEAGLNCEGVVPPESPFHLILSYRNLTSISLRLYRDDNPLSSKQNRLREQSFSLEEIKRLIQHPPLRRWTVPLKTTQDYKKKQIFLQSAPLPAGKYIIVASVSPEYSAKKNYLSYCLFQVSELAVAARFRSSESAGLAEGIVTHVRTGTPQSDVSISLFQYDYSREQYHFRQSASTDKQGFFSIPLDPKQNHYSPFKIEATLSGDSLSIPLEGYYRSSNDEKEKHRMTLFYTDRSLYRPGQTIFFKGICLETEPDKKDYHLLSGINVEVAFLDQNQQEISRMTCQTNGFGSFSGSFTAPSGRLMGLMTISTKSPSGSASIRVEEYKRPKFQVELKIPEKQFRLNETVEIEGEAVSYSGAPIDNALVRFRVLRLVRFPPWFFWRKGNDHFGRPQEILHGQMHTDASGKFVIHFPARPDIAVPASSHPIFTFHVQVDVTDTGGESRSGSTMVRAGYTSLEAELNTPDWLEAGKDIPLDVITRNLNGKPAAAKGKITIYQLIQPEHPFPEDMIGEEKIRENEFQEKNPGGKFCQTSDWKRWPEGKIISEKDFSTGIQENNPCPVTFRLKEGVYRAVLSSQDEKGAAVEFRLNLLVVNPEEKRFGIPIPLYTSSHSQHVEPGNNYEALIATGYSQGSILVEFFRSQRLLKRFWTDPSQTQHRILFPVTEELRGGFSVIFTFIQENRLYRVQKHVMVPWSDKELHLQWVHFRSRLQPGQRETWSLRITGKDALPRSAEIAASLYDESLDQYYPHSFSTLHSIFDFDQTYLEYRFSNLPNPFTGFDFDLNPHISFFPESYRTFPTGIAFYNTISAWSVDRSSKSVILRSRAVPPPPQEGIAPKEVATGSGIIGGVEAIEDSREMDAVSMGAPPPDLKSITARKNLQETAFFFPQLLTEKDGSVTMSFTMPEALTRWRFLAFAHTQALENGLMEDYTVTQKELMVQPNPPRFLREGDILEFPVKVSNLSEKTAVGNVRLTFFDPRDEHSLDSALKNVSLERNVSIPPKESRIFSWTVSIPDGLSLIAFKAVAATADFSDGEEGQMPVLSRSILVQEALPLWITGTGTRKFRFENLLKSGASPSLRHISLTLQMTSNPAWYAVQALPYLMEFPHECSEQVFHRLYANALAQHIAVSNPRIRRIFDEWKGTKSLASNLEKNQELKNILLQETPWVLQAFAESDAKERIALLFDANHIDYELQKTWTKLEQMQYPDGSWPWFPGGPKNEYITLLITTGLGRLKVMGIGTVSQEPALKALHYLDSFLQKQYRKIVDTKELQRNHLDSMISLYLYCRSFYVKEAPIPPSTKEAFDYFLEQGRKFGVTFSGTQSRAHLALALHRFGDQPTAEKIMRSLREYSRFSEEMGRSWSQGEASWFWYDAPIETQALMIEAFDEVMQDTRTVEECKIWLLKQKQTQDWRTTKATADAVFALLRCGEDLLSSDIPVSVKLGGAALPSDKGEAGTGFFEKRFDPSRISPAMGEIDLEKVDPGIAWGGLHWQYLEDISRIPAHTQTPLRLEKALFVKRFTGKGPVIEPVQGPLAVGDEVVVRLKLKVDRSMEFIHLKDHRGSGLEPVHVLSQYRFQDGLYYYESTRDSAVHFFIDTLPPGNYVFEYPLRVVHRGKYPSGLASIECMYAPEFNSHSQSLEIVAK